MLNPKVKMEINEVNVETEEVETEWTKKFEVPETFKAKYSENPDLAIEELYRAQHKIVEQKKAEKKEIKVENPTLSREELEKFYAEKKFFEDKPSLLEYKDQINEFTSKGLTFSQAEKLVIDANPDISARNIAQKTNFTAWAPDYTSKNYTMEQLAEIGKRSPSKYAELIRDFKAGKINVT